MVSSSSKKIDATSLLDLDQDCVFQTRAKRSLEQCIDITDYKPKSRGDMRLHFWLKDSCSGRFAVTGSSRIIFENRSDRDAFDALNADVVANGDISRPAVESSIDLINASMEGISAPFKVKVRHDAFRPANPGFAMTNYGLHLYKSLMDCTGRWFWMPDHNSIIIFQFESDAVICRMFVETMK